MLFLPRNPEKKFKSENIIETILKNRGIENVEKFLNPRIEHLHDPFLFKDMKIVSERIQKAIDGKESISIYADYDVDGTSACSILLLALQKAGARVSAYIPKRSEGYGLNKGGLKYLKENKQTDLLITVDCGITAVEEVRFAKSLGMDVIVTDHHEPPEVLPDALAVLDAKIEGETYPFKELCGAGVAFKIVQAVFGLWEAMNYIDLASLATVADVVPLLDENRTITYFGLQKINGNPNLGLSKLLSAFSITEANSFHYGFSLGPAINAAGRMETAQIAAMLMISKKPERASEIAAHLFQLNKKRKEIQNEIFEQAKEKADSEKRCKIICGEDWNKGVIGIVASKITDLFSSPSIIFSKQGSMLTGSARSIDGINIYEVLKKHASLLESFGGHEQAAGMKIKEENLPKFMEQIESEMHLFPEDIFEKKMVYDEIVEIEEISEELIMALSQMEPFGKGNEKPLFLIKAAVSDIQTMGKKEEHFRCHLSNGKYVIKGVGFSQEPPREHLSHMILLGEPNLNEYNGKKELSFYIRGYAPDESSIKEKSEEIPLAEEKKIPSKKSEEENSFLNLDKKKLNQFYQKKIFNEEDLLHYLPKKYEDYSKPKTVKTAISGEKTAIIGQCVGKKMTKNRGLYLSLKDSNGDFFGAMFHQKMYLYSEFHVGKIYIFCGMYKVQEDGKAIFKTITPDFFSENINEMKKISSSYSKIRGMSDEFLKFCIEKALENFSEKEIFEKEVEDKFQMISQKEAFQNLHFPETMDDVAKGKHRFQMESFFEFSFYMNRFQPKTEEKSEFVVKSNHLWETLKNRIPFTLTADQNHILETIYQQMKEGIILNSLIQGDVGSGKTILAFFVMLLAKEAGFQSALIAPTEILAKQHYEKLFELMGDKLNIVYLASSLKSKEKKEALAAIAKDADIVIGTHAVFQDQVHFSNLGLVIIDEQHRFGVKQREKLCLQEKRPHTIIMSATPIPRTLSLSLFGGGNQVHSIKTKPAGRKEIETKIMKKEEESYSFIEEEIKKGHQAYIVCPFIENSDSDQFKEVSSVEEEAQKVKSYFKKDPSVQIGVISGKMKSDEIDAEITKFYENKTQILISTTIVEVGIDVPNATVILLKSSDRFGLAQAHQLRGRVGRGKDQSYCLLQPNNPMDEKAIILSSNSSGFDIAKKDLELRGSGNFFGEEQSGGNSFVLDIVTEKDLYQQIDAEVKEIIKDPKRYSFYKNIFDFEIKAL